MAEKYTLKCGKVLKDGHTMFLEDVVADLKRKSDLEDKLKDFVIRERVQSKDADERKGELTVSGVKNSVYCSLPKKMGHCIYPIDDDCNGCVWLIKT